MIRPGTIATVAFGSEADGDARVDVDARVRISSELGIPAVWATISQIHGTGVRIARSAGPQGDADALVTDRPDVPIVIATADCVPIAIEGSSTIALVHAGWRGVAAGVIGATLSVMDGLGDRALRAVIGPHIGPCCYEVGADVVDAVGGHRATTRWGTISVDLGAAVSDQLGDIDVERVDICTMDDDRYASHRRDGTLVRQVTVAWLP
jgi:purine-nucleoside/S-methyl-5'-thioadenosine phosphorylase / adenosine deaminase